MHSSLMTSVATTVSVYLRADSGAAQKGSILWPFRNYPLQNVKPEVILLVYKLQLQPYLNIDYILCNTEQFSTEIDAFSGHNSGLRRIKKIPSQSATCGQFGLAVQTLTADSPALMTTRVRTCRTGRSVPLYSAM